MLLPTHFVLTRDLLDFWLFGGMNHFGRRDALCIGLNCASHRPLLRRNRNRGFQRDIPHCHIFSDVIDVAPDPKPLRRGPGSFLLLLRCNWRGLRLGRAVRRRLLGCEGYLLLIAFDLGSSEIDTGEMGPR